MPLDENLEALFCENKTNKCLCLGVDNGMREKDRILLSLLK